MACNPSRVFVLEVAQQLSSGCLRPVASMSRTNDAAHDSDVVELPARHHVPRVSRMLAERRARGRVVNPPSDDLSRFCQRVDELLQPSRTSTGVSAYYVE